MKYLIVWSGGYEAPDYMLQDTLEQAILEVKSIIKGGLPSGDTLDVLRLNIETNTLVRLSARDLGLEEWD